MSAVERAMALLSRWDAASVPDDLGLHDAGGFAQRNCTEIREALRKVLAALSTPLARDGAVPNDDYGHWGGTEEPPADDVREAVAAKRWCGYFGCRVVVYEADDYFGQGCPVCGHVGQIGEVCPHGTVTDAEVEAAGRSLGGATWRTQINPEYIRVALEAAREARS